MQKKTSKKLVPEQWISKYYTFFLGYVRGKISNDYDVEELIQETFLSALKSARNYEQKASEKTWLMSILNYKIIDYYRANNTLKGKVEKYMISHEDYKERYHKEYGERSFYKVEYHDSQSYRELKGKILLKLKGLPKKQAEVFEMRVFKELETETICEKLNISRDYAWVLMCRAKKTLSSSLCNELV